MEFAIVPVLVLTLKVVDAIGNVGGLLDFSNKTARTNGMNTPRRDEEYVTLMDFVASQGIGDGIVIDHRLVLFWRDFLFQAVIELCAGSRFERIPHLGLSA